MKAAFFTKVKDKIQLKQFVFRHGGVNKYDDEKMSSMFLRKMYRIPEIQFYDGDAIVVTVKNNATISDYKLFDMFIKEEDNTILFYVEKFKDCDYELKKKIFNFAVKALINLFGKQPISITEPIKGMKKVLFVMVDNDYLYAKQTTSKT